MRHKPIEHQVVVVMGASSGIGRETALRFAQRGARLVLSDNDEVGLQSLLQAIQQENGKAVALAADVASFDQVQAVADRAAVEYGLIDTWVHCAAVLLAATFVDTTPEEFQRVVDVNLMGQVHGAKAALSSMLRTGRGGLIHISSVEAARAFPYHSAYSAAKHGVHGFLEALRLELKHAELEISVTEVMPSTINTPLFDKARTKLGVKPIGMPPVYEPSTVANAVLHAAEHPSRQVIVGGAGKMLVQTQRMSPRLLDAMLLRTAFTIQKSDELKPAESPNNLFVPVAGYDRVEGDFEKTLSHSFATWLDRHPLVKATATVGTAFGVGALLAARSGDDRKVEPKGQ